MRGPLSAIAVLLVARQSTAAVYDRAITVFSPDGKLMQVAYADEAVNQGSLAVAASNGRDAIVLCIERPAAKTTEHNEQKNDESGSIIDGDDNPDENSDGRPATPTASSTSTNIATISGTRRASDRDDDQDAEDHSDDDVERPWSRHRYNGGGVRDPGAGVGIVDSANNQDRKLCEIDEGVYLAFAGISADGRVLASKIRLECQSYRYSMGAAPSMGYIARYVGGLQHRYTRTGGARPFGVACLIAGFDEDTLLPCVFRSEPSGAFAEWTASAVGRASEKALGELEAVPDLGALDWRETAEASVRAALSGGAKECDVLVLRLKDEEKAWLDRRSVAGGEGQAEGEESRRAPAPTQEEEDERGTVDEGVGGAGAGGRGAWWRAAGWRDRGGREVSRRFLGSVGVDGEVKLEAEEGDEGREGWTPGRA